MLTCVSVADAARLGQWQLPPGRVRRAAFVDDDQIDVWLEAAGGANNGDWSPAGSACCG